MGTIINVVIYKPNVKSIYQKSRTNYIRNILQYPAFAENEILDIVCNIPNDKINKMYDNGTLSHLMLYHNCKSVVKYLLSIPTSDINKNTYDIPPAINYVYMYEKLKISVLT